MSRLRRVRLALAVVLMASLLLTLGSPAVQAAGSPQTRVFVTFDRKPGPNEQAIVRGVGGTIRYTYDIIPTIAASVPQAAIAGLLRNPHVLRVEPVLRAQAADAQLDSTWGVKRIGAGAVQNGNNKGAGVKVAVIDSGVNCNHPDLKGACVGGYDFVNNDTNPADDYGHGTHVAGTISARDNGAGVVGVAPEAQILAYKVLDANGGGGYDDIIAAVQRAVSDGARITNNSYGSAGDPGLAVKQAFDNAYAAGVLNVGAAGNSGTADTTVDNVIYPARYDSVIAVAATDSSDLRAGFSSTGPAVELAAPGVGVVSTTMGGGYEAWNGTSMATPHVSGAAALVIASGVTGAANVRDRLDSTAQALGSSTNFGYGLVRADLAAPSTSGVPVITMIGPASGTTFIAGTPITFSGSAVDSNGGDLTGGLAWTATSSGGTKVTLGSGGSVSKALSAGTYTVTASVADATGKTDRESRSITVLNSAKSVSAVRIDAGGARYVDSKRLTWSADTSYWLGASYSTTAAIAGTTADPLYQTERYGNMSYVIPVPPGSYKVTLKFAEIYHTQVGQRVFDVSIEGQPVLSHFDILQHVAANTAYDQTFYTTVSSDGILNVDFTTEVDNAKVSAIEVVRQ